MQSLIKPFFFKLLLVSKVALAISISVLAQQSEYAMSFVVSMNNPQTHSYHVELNYSGNKKDTLNFKMPVWMPGYYQLMNYAKNVENFRVINSKGDEIRWNKTDSSTWQVFSKKAATLKVSYNIKATVQFVAANYLDQEHGYISPCGVFLYLDGEIDRPVTLIIKPYKKWLVATALDPVSGKQYTYTAPNFDILYDCPILIGELEELTPFFINGIKHRFIGYRMGEFNREMFMNDLKKVVEAGISIIGDIPYKQYTFLAIGPGRGGIEHLNSTTISFDGKSLNTNEGRVRMLTFIAHEYFHHYNIKRIRPIELGPFDYNKGNRTNLLWVSEGLTVYYAYLILKRAGLITKNDLFHLFQSSIAAFENNPGRLHQSLTQASYETWSDGPFGTSGKKVNRTISYYDKGPAIGLLLDFDIRYATKNKKSLDDVMRLLYNEYYLKKKRGFSDAEFQQACETVADTSLSDIFEYVNTVKDIDYNKYLAYAGLNIRVTQSDTTNTTSAIEKRSFNIVEVKNAGQIETTILKKWAGD